jgi:hypothetical protein
MKNAKVFKNRIMLATFASCAAVVPIAGLCALTARPAGADEPGISCLNTSATVFENSARFKLLGCVTGNVGGEGKITTTTSATSATVKWANGKKTTFTQSITAGSGCVSGDLTEDLSGTVTRDTTGSTSVGAAVGALLCYDVSTGKLTLLTGTKFVFAA